MLNELEKKLENLRKRIERELRILLHNDEKFAENLYNMIYHHLGWNGKGLSGKMFRPIFGLLCCETARGDIEKALPAVAAVELLHNFSLIHDDIQDNADERRGRKTVWAIWGKPQAINAGDALFTIARNALLKIEEKVSDARLTLESLQLMDEACMSLCKGQFLDITYEDLLHVDIDDFLRMIKLKTGSLWGLSGQLGVLVGTKDRKKAEIFKKIGENIGITFQIQDDIFNIWGQKEITGKNGNDLQNHKKNMPVVYALKRDQSAHISRLYRKKELLAEDVLEIKRFIEDTGSKDFCVGMAKRYGDEAKSILNKVQKNSTLEAMIDFLLKRQY